MSRLPLLALLATACEDPPREVETGPVTLAVLHVATSAGDVEVSVNGESSGPLAYLASVDGITTQSDATLLIDSTSEQAVLTLDGRPGDDMVSLVLADLDGTLTGTSLTLAFDEPPASQALVRLVHGSPDLGAVSFDVDGDGVADTNPLSFRDATGPRGIAIATGATTVTAINGDGQAVAQFALSDVAAGSAFVSVVTGFSASAAPAEALTLVGPGDAGASPMRPAVHVVHAVNGVGAVDVFAGEALVADQLFYGELAPPMFLGTGPQTLSLYPDSDAISPPADDALTTVHTPHLTLGERYLTVLTTEGPAVAADTTHPGSLAGLHAATEVDDVTIGIVSGDAFFSSTLPSPLAFAEASAEAAVIPSGPIDLGMRTDGALRSYGTLSAGGDERWTGIAVSGEQGEELWLVDQSTASWSMRQYFADVDEDSDADTDLDSDTEVDTDVDTDSDSDSDTDVDTDTDTTGLPPAR